MPANLTRTYLQLVTGFLHTTEEMIPLNYLFKKKLEENQEIAPSMPFIVLTNTLDFPYGDLK